MTIVANPRAYKIPDWFLNRQKDIKDGRYSQARTRTGCTCSCTAGCSRSCRASAAALQQGAVGSRRMLCSLAGRRWSVQWPCWLHVA